MFLRWFASCRPPCSAPLDQHEQLDQPDQLDALAARTLSAGPSVHSDRSYHESARPPRSVFPKSVPSAQTKVLSRRDDYQTTILRSNEAKPAADKRSMQSGSAILKSGLPINSRVYSCLSGVVGISLGGTDPPPAATGDRRGRKDAIDLQTTRAVRAMELKGGQPRSPG
jgi:hypothetical protein